VSSLTFVFFLLSILSLAALFFVSACAQVIHRYRNIASEKITLSPSLFWKAHLLICKDPSINALLFYLKTSQYILAALYFLFYTSIFIPYLSLSEYLTQAAWSDGMEILKAFSFFLGFVGPYFLFSDIFPRTWCYFSAQSLLRISYHPASLFLLLLSPLLLPLGLLFRWIAPQETFSIYSEPEAHLLEVVRSIEHEIEWTESDRRVLLSVLHFRDRIAREIMRPRVELFCIPDNLTVQQAAEMLHEEGFSRVPVYKETIDTIVGVLFYKDLLAKYIQATKKPDSVTILNTPVSALMKKVYYCPETKKIATLLQEFRKRQTHISVVVDEYGGTSGLVTIEDILEEIVGEIADEYDIEEILFKPAPRGGWVVDARMNLLDIEEELGIQIPQEEDYDTLAGYVFYRVGSIPQAGLILHHDRFELEITKSNDRMVEEVRITPIIETSEEITSS